MSHVKDLPHANLFLGLSGTFFGIGRNFFLASQAYFLCGKSGKTEYLEGSKVFVLLFVPSRINRNIREQHGDHGNNPFREFKVVLFGAIVIP